MLGMSFACDATAVVRQGRLDCIAFPASGLSVTSPLSSSMAATQRRRERGTLANQAGAVFIAAAQGCAHAMLIKIDPVARCSVMQASGLGALVDGRLC